jgi:hypothetical protein
VDLHGSIVAEIREVGGIEPGTTRNGVLIDRKKIRPFVKQDYLHTYIEVRKGIDQLVR